jgi:hypothetical protein
MSKKFKIGLDIHGVIDAMPEFFSFLSHSLVSNGGEVHILTGGNLEEGLKDLEKFNIAYTHIFSIQEYHRQKQTPTYAKHPRYGFEMVSNEEWDKSKGDYCVKYGIDLHIDDTMEYNNFFQTPFCRLWSHNNHPKPERKDKRHMK